MESLKTEDIVDTKVVNNTTYKLVKRVENGVKMKLWIPEYLVQRETNTFAAAMKSANLTPDEKVHHLYNQLKKFSADEVNNLQISIVKLDLNHLPRSHKNEITSMITRMIQLYQNERKICHPLVHKLRLWIQQEELVNERRQQLTLLFCLQEEINLVSKSVKKIEIQNNVDMEILPFNFSYVNSITPGPQVSFPENPPIGCDCVGKRSCFLNKCCPEMFNRQTTYNEFGEVMVPPQVAIYECNKSCRCAKLCTNRVVQRGSSVKLTIFRKTKRRWGVRAAEFIKKNSFVIEFTGEVIKRENVTPKNLEETPQLMFDLDFNTQASKGLYTINCTEKGNISRFVNDSENPNLNVYSVWINWSDPHIYHVALFAARDISVDEEITFARPYSSQQSNSSTKN